MNKTPAQIQKEVDDHLREMRALEAELSQGDMTSANTQIAYRRLDASPSSRPTHRWIGRCRRCDAEHRVEGRIASAYASPGHHDSVVRATDGRLLTTSAQGTDPTLIWVPCGDHHCLLRRVHEGTKRSKHQCGARCTNATGPSCDCRCKGENHGRNVSP